MHRIIEGRSRVLSLPRQWVLERVERVAHEALDLSDYWEYGRFLEVLELLGAHESLRRHIATGLESPDEDVRDIAELWKRKSD